MARPPQHEGEVHPANSSRTIILATVVTLSLLLAACSSGATAPAAQPPNVQSTATLIPVAPPNVTPIPTSAPEMDVPFEEPFLIQLGQSLSVGSTDLRFTFLEVVEDSRCPSDVVCIWEGPVVVLEAGGDDLYSENLPVGLGAAAVANIGGYLVEAASVEPYPVSTGTHRPVEISIDVGSVSKIATQVR